MRTEHALATRFGAQPEDGHVTNPPDEAPRPGPAQARRDAAGLHSPRYRPIPSGSMSTTRRTDPDGATCRPVVGPSRSVQASAGRGVSARAGAARLIVTQQSSSAMRLDMVPLDSP